VISPNTRFTVEKWNIPRFEPQRFAVRARKAFEYTSSNSQGTYHAMPLMAADLLAGIFYFFPAAKQRLPNPLSL
jgi:hypothetical protein